MGVDCRRTHLRDVADSSAILIRGVFRMFAQFQNGGQISAEFNFTVRPRRLKTVLQSGDKFQWMLRWIAIVRVLMS